MAAIYRRMLDAQVLSANERQPLSQTLDAGSYNTLQLQFRILKAGTGTGLVLIQHAATNEESAFRDFPTPAVINVGAGASDGFITIANFTRYIRWVTDPNVAGGPVITLDIVAKE